MGQMVNKSRTIQEFHTYSRFMNALIFLSSIEATESLVMYQVALVLGQDTLLAIIWV